jgi:four helix bundle protein
MWGEGRVPHLSHRHRDLIVWQKAKALASETYRVTEKFPKSEVYGLTSQLRRAAVSVVSNIAEGQVRLTTGDFRHFLGQARGSLLELETQVAIAVELNYLAPSEFDKLDLRTSKVRRLLNGLIASLRARKTTAAS